MFFVFFFPEYNIEPCQSELQGKTIHINRGFKSWHYVTFKLHCHMYIHCSVSNKREKRVHVSNMPMNVCGKSHAWNANYSTKYIYKHYQASICQLLASKCVTFHTHSTQRIGTFDTLFSLLSVLLVSVTPKFSTQYYDRHFSFLENCYNFKALIVPQLGRWTQSIFSKKKITSPLGEQ